MSEALNKARIASIKARALKLSGAELAAFERSRRGLTLREAAVLACTSHTHIWRIETGRDGVGRVVAERLATAYQVPAYRFLCAAAKPSSALEDSPAGDGPDQFSDCPSPAS